MIIVMKLFLLILNVYEIAFMFHIYGSCTSVFTLIWANSFYFDELCASYIDGSCTPHHISFVFHIDESCTLHEMSFVLHIDESCFPLLPGWAICSIYVGLVLHIRWALCSIWMSLVPHSYLIRWSMCSI